MAGDIATSVVGTMLEPIRDSLYAFIRRQFGYLVHCKENIKDFEDEVEKLRDAKGRIQTKVDSALQNAEVIEDDVSRWLAKVQTSLPTMEEDCNRLQRGIQNLKCFDVRSRFRLGKEGKKKQAPVTKLIEDGSNFDSVSHRPLLTRTWHRTYTINYETFQSRELVFKEIMKALKDDSTYKIGIYGMPGVGKTRMMKEVAQLASKERLFDDIAETVVTENPKVNKIQQKLAAGLNLTLDKEDEGANKELLQNRLRNGRKIFVMVDDVWGSEIKLEDIGIPAADDHTKGSKILLTSRRQDVCKEMGVPENYNFQIGVLSKAEAWSLFEKKVGDSFESDEMRSLAEAVCEECAGLPVAILAVGGAVKNKSKQVWKDALDKMKNSRADYIGGMPAKLYSRIELSYDYLQPDDAKKLFLVCCLCPEDDEIPIDFLVRLGFGMRLLPGVDTMEKARNRVHAIVDTLETSSLLLEGSSEGENWVKMHDIIRDVAISIASKQEDAMFLVREGVEKWPEEDEYKRCRAISLFFNDDCVLPDDLECPELRTLILVCDDPLEAPHNFFRGMEKLEALLLSHMHIPTLSSSLKNLRMLHLIDCSVNLAYLRELKELKMLTIQDSELEVLAQEIGQLTHLQLLDLRGCDNLMIIPSGVISSLSQLEELYIPGEFDQWEVEGNASLTELHSLTRLVSLEIHMPNVELVALNELPFKSLIQFKISIGCKLQTYEISSSATKILKFKDIPFKRGFNILMEKTEALCLFQLKGGLKNVFQDREGKGFEDLKYLKVESCDEMEHLFGKLKWNSHISRSCASGSFGKLSFLELINCKSMICVFSVATATGLPQLQELTLSGCEIMEEIVRDDHEVMDIVSFHRLKKMKMEWLPNLRSFYVNTKKTSTTGCNTSTHMQALFNDKVAFPALEELKIQNLKNITAIWDDQSQSLLVKEAEDSFGRLRYMEVSACEKMEEIVAIEMGQEEDAVHDEIIVFPQLKHLSLEKLPKLKSFCYSCTRGSKKQEVEIVEHNIPRVESLFNHKVKFPCLEGLEIKELDNLKELWHNTISTDSASKLRKLKLIKCHRLLNVASTESLASFQNLEEVKVLQCGSLQEVFKVEGSKEAEGRVASDKAIGKEVENNLVFPKLKKVVFEELPCLTSFYKNSCISELTSLLRMEVRGCPILKMFPCRYLNTVALKTVDAPLQPFFWNEKVACPILKKLVLCDVSIFEGIWDGHLPAGSFCKVRFLELKGYNNLVNACTLLQWFEVVEELTLESCYSLEVIFNLEGPDAIERMAILSSQTKQLRLRDLPKLERIWIRDPMQGLLVFHNLTSLTVNECNSLRYVFSLSIARGLTQLRRLEIDECSVMEEIVRSEGQGEEDDTEEIVFSRLEDLYLCDLPNLTSFCGANNAFKFPSLKEVSLWECAKLQTFAYGGISTPGIEVNGDDVSDLNNYVEQYVRKEKGLAVDNDDEETSNEEEKEEKSHDEEDIMIN